MPRRQFVADFVAAKISNIVDFIDDLKTGDEDGQFVFSFKHPLSHDAVTINALINDVSEYPRSHEYYIFMADDAPQAMCQSINSSLSSTRGKTVTELLRFVSSTLAVSLRDSDGDALMPDSQNESDLAEEDSQDDESEPELNLDDDLLKAPSVMTSASSSAPHLSSPFRQRLISDLRATKAAGFKVGYLGPLTEGRSAYVTIACRIKKLGISVEAMQAWKVDPDDYLILLIQYSSGYKPLNSLKRYDPSQLRESMQMRVGASKTYKPTLQEAILAFHGERNDTVGKTDTSGFHETFISRPLNDLLNERLLALLKQKDEGMSWHEAESYYNEFRGASSSANKIDNKYKKPETNQGTYPPIVRADHFADHKTDPSFPLLAMQYLLRHFVRCTEFCLICHRHLSNDLQAIKPYVCENPLCLYQYMSLGFGPSIEHEITAQPYVVDLLVSFCYLSAIGGKFDNFPTGLSIMVPPPQALQVESVLRNPTRDAAMPVKFDKSHREILFDDQSAKSPVKQGDWIVIRIKQALNVYHCRVADASLYPSVRLDELIPGRKADENVPPSQDRPPTPPDTAFAGSRSERSPKWVEAIMDTYSVKFDGLGHPEKRQLIIKLLDTLPSVKDMQEFLAVNRTSNLKMWLSRISPSASALLRWIIASNRACIMQVDDLEIAENVSASSSERVHGMPNWVQFRFAMGAPDKERRFVQAVRDTSHRLNLEYPTLFAWHGSPLQNWHSIIREGLNFNQTLNGRAFGHGCYHSLQYNTSLGYTNSRGGLAINWPGSLLRVTAAMSLNEIVNAPSEFVSSTPHLVVAQLDWIQTRYLFVQSSDTSIRDAVKEAQLRSSNLNIRPQDPRMTPTGEKEKIIIPAKIGTSLQRLDRDKVVKVESGQGSSKLRKVISRITGSGTQSETIELTEDDDDDDHSIATLEEDRELLIEEPAVATNTARALIPKSNFVPGALDHSRLPRMPEPSYANITASKRLQADLKALLKVQDSSSLEELGWYIDREKLDNVYQWIVELHSFEAFRDKGKDIPLVDDMKKKGIQSIVLEIRFPGSYPMSPPFIRVVRPRFLGFQQGGGGHVTAGGALCMELLTNSGWSAVSSIESVLLQVRMAIASTEPQPARIESDRQYGVGEAIEAYKRACMAHGWRIPSDFASLAQG